MKTQTYFSNIKEGKLQKNVAEQIAKDLKSFEGKRVAIKIQIKRKDRSLEQNRYYFGVICAMFQDGAKETWGEDLSKEEAHENLKVQCNYKEFINEESGEIFKISKTTTDLTTVQFEEYLERCRKFIFLWFNITVPLPGEQLEYQFENQK